ncbi:alpha/beta-hydrolase [Fomitiporia mediterranea MF3/22]|uniref:alpha/beta-hydrolase n=1 Tax=Fomitiporia mediterranea (strain MF3/22) TaxID=694068 RepID=UPI00044079A7|nr:alpha/beta-hydrolase [Fomitiporia mediterranea MF3/22]EJC98555.1 alpha/beta-hydrolase [Fomitiporia mediterranea MF3/22]
MYSLLSVFALTFALSAAHPAADSALHRRAISQDLLDTLTRFTKFASAAYQANCPSPVGTTLVQQFNNDTTNTQGFIARDDTNKQIIVSFRGSQQLQDFVTDADIVLTPFTSPGVQDTNNARAHSGFLSAFNSVAPTVISTVSQQLSANPGFSLISTGHSLGASLASLGGVSLASNFPGTPLQVFTLGQPRTGDPAYAQLVENLVGGDNTFRAVHTTDGVPTIIPQSFGYRHHTTEFWNFQDPSIAANVKQCVGEEDPTCSDSIPSMGIDAAHLVYFGQVMGLDPTLCN